jgi:hypothetical protein
LDDLHYVSVIGGIILRIGDRESVRLGIDRRGRRRSLDVFRPLRLRTASLATVTRGGTGNRLSRLVGDDNLILFVVHKSANDSVRVTTGLRNPDKQPIAILHPKRWMTIRHALIILNPYARIALNDIQKCIGDRRRRKARIGIITICAHKRRYEKEARCGLRAGKDDCSSPITVQLYTSPRSITPNKILFTLHTQSFRTPI